jgi:hypothetical protein
MNNEVGVLRVKKRWKGKTDLLLYVLERGMYIICPFYVWLHFECPT